MAARASLCFAGRADSGASACDSPGFLPERHRYPPYCFLAGLLLTQLRAGRCVGVEISENILYCGQYVLRPHRIGIEVGGVSERGEVGSAFAVSPDPGQAV